MPSHAGARGTAFRRKGRLNQRAPRAFAYVKPFIPAKAGTTYIASPATLGHKGDPSVRLCEFLCVLCVKPKASNARSPLC